MNFAAIAIIVEKQWENGNVTTHQMILPIEQIRYIMNENDFATVTLTNDQCFRTTVPFHIVEEKYHSAMRYQHDPEQPSLY